MSCVSSACLADDTAAHTTGSELSHDEVDARGCSGAIAKPEARFMNDNTASGDEVTRLKAEIKRLQNVVRRMSTLDVKTGKGVIRAPAIAAIAEQGMSSDAGLFDSYEEADREELDRLTLENANLKRDVEHMREEIASLKELCETKNSALSTLSPAEVHELEERVADRLLRDVENNSSLGEMKIPLLVAKQNKEMLELRNKLAHFETSPVLITIEGTTLPETAVDGTAVSRSSGKIDEIHVAETVAEMPARSRSIIDEALKVDAIVNGTKSIRISVANME